MFYEDFAVGQIFTTPARTVLDADIASFAGWSWDTNPVHTDVEHMRASRFGQPIAHGLLGVSVAMGLVSRLGIFEDSSIALLGIDDWRFRLPILAGDTVRVRLEILAARTTSDGASGIPTGASPCSTSATTSCRRAGSGSWWPGGRPAESG